jgi:Flp pilus assembly protein TadG
MDDLNHFVRSRRDEQGARTGFLDLLIRFRRGERGVAAVEFAFIVPIMLLLYIGTWELSNGVAANRKLSRVSSTLSDLVTQSQSLSCDDIGDIMKAASKVMYPYDSQAQIVLTGISIDGAGSAKVQWSHALNHTAYAANSVYPSVPSPIKVNGSYLVAAKVMTTYQPFVGWASYSATDGFSLSNQAIAMDEEMFLRPRMSSTIAVPATCPAF